ncbi:hypothetical protein ACRTDU_04050 [Sunxiuqinia elliptica]
MIKGIIITGNDNQAKASELRAQDKPVDFTHRTGMSWFCAALKCVKKATPSNIQQDQVTK